jgi:hypothetical protein
LRSSTLEILSSLAYQQLWSIWRKQDNVQYYWVYVNAFDIYLLLLVMCVMETNKNKHYSISQSFVLVLEGIRSTSNWRFIWSKIWYQNAFITLYIIFEKFKFDFYCRYTLISLVNRIYQTHLNGYNGMWIVVVAIVVVISEPLSC